MNKIKLFLRDLCYALFAVREPIVWPRRRVRAKEGQGVHTDKEGTEILCGACGNTWARVLWHQVGELSLDLCGKCYMEACTLDALNKIVENTTSPVQTSGRKGKIE